MIRISRDECFLQRVKVPNLDLKGPDALLNLELLRLQEFIFRNMVYNILLLLIAVNIDGCGA